MKKRVFLSMLSISLLTIILISTFITAAMYNDFSSERKSELKTEAAYISKALEDSGLDYLKDIGKDSTNRLSLISPDGTVIYDNYADTAKLENHKDRPEFADALKKGSGEATRLSGTLGENTYYYALKLDSGNILRVSFTTKSIFGVVKHTIFFILLITLLVFLLAVAAARIFTKSIVAPINRLNLDNPLSNNTYDELTPLLSRMDMQNKKISAQIRELETKQNEFNAITNNMNEALVIFGENRHVLFANKSASKLFENVELTGKGYLELCRDMGYIRSVEAAFEGKSSSDTIVRNGRVYQLSVNPVNRNDKFAVVFFAVDITEKEQNEKIRREFTANVSHELKTPLTTIMGCAEIMKNGIAKQEDFPHFTEQIYYESKRLLTLIDDIIRLSKLDENSIQNEFKFVDLYKLSEKVIAQLKSKADRNNIKMMLEGGKIGIPGIEEVLHEMIFNLCDNAVTYNKQGGSVLVKIEESGNKVALSVKDTGIGIASKHHDRIFERFYRVDKSRSKETGGTGLGLSIVKHGALLHHADIELKSKPGEGTEVKLIFNLQ